MDTLKLVEEKLPTLSRQERKVAMRVIQDPDSVKQMSINTLAKAVGVSNATITRFVKKMDCHNFYDFKLKLTENHSTNSNKVEKGSIPDEVFSFYKHVLNDTWESLDVTSLRTIVDLISKCNRIYIFGIGSSGYTAQEMTQRLLRMGIAAFPMTESHIMYITSGIMGKNDIILALSTSGNTNDLNRAAQAAQLNGTKVIGITGIKKSPLYELSDYPILVKNSNFVDNTRFINSQFAITYALDIITTMLLENKTYSDRMNHTVEMILDNKFRTK
ncbi:MurR/RpiR family transcriptional regulator [Companilactobacillus allii]|uniref:RpiR family transcriptional regulator n=1 Tax=Companilactobacillus allii TaxID=1847728 RepID=A0A1P8Q194_9LACO|nr:MurR/RpiR family transcriptional regulator [Companilactobacillus allii]APX71630.1 RpiR family transcriptional regulator [Companilactobacillus allii]USQ68713.1 MurR/RpiR family transcriptional regulator [Companilactobacillus allii]